jgi:hypothetical protein
MLTDLLRQDRGEIRRVVGEIVRDEQRRLAGRAGAPPPVGDGSGGGPAAPYNRGGRPA